MGSELPEKCLKIAPGVESRKGVRNPAGGMTLAKPPVYL
jgi:hypothetical protein